MHIFTRTPTGARIPSQTPTPTGTDTPTDTPTATNTPTPATPYPIGNFYFPPTGETLDQQNLKAPGELGLDADIITQLMDKANRWALWRHGYLVHVKGDFNQVQEVKSLRKTWHAMTVGAAIQQGLLPSYDAKIKDYVTGLEGADRQASFKDVIIQSAGFDYPGCGIDIDYLPGEMWTYSDYNPHYLNRALAQAYGKDYTASGYKSLLQQAYFDAIGMQGWNASINTSDLGGLGDGVRLSLDLEDMGRLGLLALTGGNWDGNQLVPQWFVQELQVKQTSGMQVNYDGCNNGVLPYLKTPGFPFPESPYGYMTWTNSDEDYYQGADPGWAWGYGAGGFYVLWNQENGIVFAGVGVDNFPKSSGGIPHIIEANITGPNPLH